MRRNRGLTEVAIRMGFIAVLLACAAAICGAAQQDVHKPLSSRTPNLGPNVLVFDPSMPASAIQSQIDKVYAIEQHSEFGPVRYALLFTPGKYRVNVPVGFYTQVLGLGATPDSVEIDGDVHADASLPHNNATCTFWRAAEGFSVNPDGGAMQWAVSQAAPLRRMHIRGDLLLHQKGGWASGGWMSDTLVDGTVASGTQQQWISRNSEWRAWTGGNWNIVFLGVPNAPAAWPRPPYTAIEKTPVIREKPFLEVDKRGRWSVRVPALARNTEGVTWRDGATPGRSLPLSAFYIARPEMDTSATMNAALAKGKDLLLTPGIYLLDDAIHVTRPNTVVMGLGFATLRPTRGSAALVTADRDGIEIAGLLIDAGPVESPVLLQVGRRVGAARHAANPICLHDVFFRVGGAGPGRARVNLLINSSDTIVDHTWIWRADHGAGVGWDTNPSTNGLVVNGENVTAYGLFVEHHQQYQVLWNGNGGRTYFYQSEIPYDPPDQASYRNADGQKGWASYEVGANVTRHEAWGLGVYSVFRKPDVVLSNAIQVPRAPGVRLHRMVTAALGGRGAILNVIDDTGGSTSIHPMGMPRVAEFP